MFMFVVVTIGFNSISQILQFLINRRPVSLWWCFRYFLLQRRFNFNIKFSVKNDKVLDHML